MAKLFGLLFSLPFNLYIVQAAVFQAFSLFGSLESGNFKFAGHLTLDSNDWNQYWSCQVYKESLLKMTSIWTLRYNCNLLNGFWNSNSEFEVWVQRHSSKGANAFCIPPFLESQTIKKILKLTNLSNFLSNLLTIANSSRCRWASRCFIVPGDLPGDYR